MTNASLSSITALAYLVAIVAGSQGKLPVMWLALAVALGGSCLLTWQRAKGWALGFAVALAMVLAANGHDFTTLPQRYPAPTAIAGALLVLGTVLYGMSRFLRYK